MVQQESIFCFIQIFAIEFRFFILVFVVVVIMDIVFCFACCMFWNPFSSLSTLNFSSLLKKKKNKLLLFFNKRPTLTKISCFSFFLRQSFFYVVIVLIYLTLLVGITELGSFVLFYTLARFWRKCFMFSIQEFFSDFLLFVVTSITPLSKLLCC